MVFFLFFIFFFRAILYFDVIAANSATRYNTSGCENALTLLPETIESRRFYISFVCFFLFLMLFAFTALSRKLSSNVSLRRTRLTSLPPPSEGVPFK